MSSVGVVTHKKSKCFVREKKSKCPKKNFQSVERGKKCKCRVSGVQKKNGNRKKSSRERKSKCFWMKIKVKDFAKFVLISLTLCCKTWLKFEGKFAIVERTGE